MNLFDKDFPDWESWLDGNVHVIPYPYNLDVFRTGLYNRAKRFGRRVSVRQVRENGHRHVRVQSTGPISY
jgi:hypothetical protein